MVAPRDIERAIARVADQDSFVQVLLAQTLGWNIPEGVERIDDIAYDWTRDDLRAAGLEQRLVDGQAWQIQPQTPSQPWGVFLLQFRNADHFTSKGGLAGGTGTLRKVLRGLAPSRLRDPSLPQWRREHLLFICTHDYGQFRFAYFKNPADGKQLAPLAAFGWNQGDTHLRTLCEHNLPALAFPDDGGADADAWVRQWGSAFDVEAVTKRFFAEYHEVFEQVEASVRGVPAGEPRRLYTQRLFNRLMFLYFIQRKGWLSFQGDANYLRALFNAAARAKEDFLNERLYWTFFAGLNTLMEDEALHAHVDLKERRGEVPFLNGGLFDLEDAYDVRDAVKVPNDAFAAVFDLFERYNFTVTESTPLDIEVAVDPEMLGKVFETLVTGRHESGSYYTPRPVVAFMCRESLKHYLAAQAEACATGAGEPSCSTSFSLSRFVDEGDPTALPDPEAVLNALRRVKVCDPACGSGAYLLGMMQELLRLREALFATRGLDAVTVYRRKLEIIEKNIYGVDIDLFAVNIAKLRLWLSLAVDFESEKGEQPPPLPNLDFKIECGDSVTGPNPQEAPDMFRRLLVQSADRLAELKGRFLETYGPTKKQLAEQIKAEEAKLRDSLSDHGPAPVAQALACAAAAQAKACATGLDWRVAFAEVLKDGGFDIALANPPYVRQELFKAAKPILKRNFPQVYDGTADLYVYFYARTHQILRPGGTACFISSNKWLKAGYAEPLRRFFAASTWVASVVDFGHAKQIFQDADVFPSILVFRKPTAASPPPKSRVCAIPREQLRLDDLTRQVAAEGFEMPREKLAADSWTLEPPGVMALLEKIRHVGVALKDFAGSGPYRGILTGFNEAFIVDTPTRDRLVREHPSSEAILKKFLRGQDVDRWCSEWSGEWMIFARRGIDIGRHPAVKRHLEAYRTGLEPKPRGWAGDEWPGRKPGAYRWYEWQDPIEYWAEFNKPKVLYQEIQFHPCYTLDRAGMLANNKVFFLPSGDLYILGVLNSPLMWWHNWRYLPHMKDEAMTPAGFLMENLPIAPATDEIRKEVGVSVQRLIDITAESHKDRNAILDRLKADFGVEKPSQKLQDVAALDADALAAEVQKARGRRNPLSVSQTKALKEEHARSVRPLQALAAEARRLERRVAELVNAAYGLTPEEVALMWQTAPPRMPGEPPGA